VHPACQRTPAPFQRSAGAVEPRRCAGPAQGERGRATLRAVPLPRLRLDLEPWPEVERPQVIGVLVLAAIMIALLVVGEPGWTEIIDGANLAFHEAGHMVYGIFGARAELYGGILGQLTFPLVAAAIFFVRRQPASYAGAWIWVGQNLWNIARYMADARAQELPLVGGGEHDFTHIFTRWGVLGRDRQIASVTELLGWAIGAAAIAWLIWRWRRDGGR
jgi:hypothetical protein